MFNIEQLKERLQEVGLTLESYEKLLSDIDGKLDGENDYDWSELKDKYELKCNADTLRKASATVFGGKIRSEYEKYKSLKNTGISDNEFDLKIQKLQNEKIKVQTEKLEYSKWQREHARDELIAEKIIKAMDTLKPLIIPEYIQPLYNNKSYLLALADCHYGIEYSIKDLYGNIINEYSPEIFEQRMWTLFNKVVDIVKKEHITELNIWELGDGINGILRLNSQLMKLRYGIIDSSILYADFLANWLNELSKHVRIKFQMLMDSNHCQLRICNAPKNAFPEENMSKSMLILIKARLRGNPNIVFIDNPTGMNYSLMSTYSVLGIHGEVKNTNSNIINDFTRTYQTYLDYMIMGHAHHKVTEETGINSEVLVCRSLIGVDPYSMTLRRTSNPGASLFTFAQGEGLITEYSLKV